MSADAIFFPVRENFLEAVQEALQSQCEPGCELATDGRRVAWLPRILPGWIPLPQSVCIKSAA